MNFLKVNYAKQIISLTFIILFISSINLYAKEVDLKIAKQVAINVFLEKSGLEKSKLEIAEIIPISDNGKVAYRIFNFKPTGHIVVSNDDVVKPILGYGLSSNIDFTNLPPGLSFLLDGYKKEITSIRKQQIKQHKDIKEKWDKFASEDYLSKTLKSYTPGQYLLNTTWDQDNPYNQDCPYYPGTQDKCLVGCAGVALGQVLHYWGDDVFPDSTKTYTPSGFTNAITINFYDQDYDWDAMNHTSGDSDNAELLYHAAVAVGSNFGVNRTSGSLGGIYVALVLYFGFDANSPASKSSYSSSNWISKLKNEIDAGRPVCYAGVDTSKVPDAAHIWVIDGYKTNNTFHCNWGWDGDYNNTWYSLTALTPNVYNFDSYHSAIFNASPIISSTISGSSKVCNSNTTYSVNAPTIASVQWTRSSSLLVSGGSTETSYTVYPYSTTTSDDGYVRATIKNSHGETFRTLTKYVNVMGPDPDEVSIIIEDQSSFEVDKVCPYEDYYIFIFNNDDNCSTSSYDWNLPTGWTKYYSSSNMILANSGSSPEGLLEITATTCCDDDIIIYSEIIYEDDDCGGYFMVISPNPSTNEATLEIKSDSQKGLDENVEWEMEVYSQSQIMIEKATKLKGSQYKIKTDKWKEGVYIVRVKVKDEILTGALVVKK